MKSISNRLTLFETSAKVPEVRVSGVPHDSILFQQLKFAGLESLDNLEAWNVDERSKQLAYSTHGMVRFFGKYPPPIARHFLELHTVRGNTVLDPMCGSGTSIVEGIHSDRNVIGFDLNPFSVMISQAKTTKLDQAQLEATSAEVLRRVQTIRSRVPDLSKHMRNPSHWFLPETIIGLGKIKGAIAKATDSWLESRPFFEATFASIIRTCSKATDQQGRLFLDIESALPDPLPTFKRRLQRSLAALEELPRSACITPEVRDASRPLGPNTLDAAFLHPPYFNSYKYSSIFSLEMAWLEYDRSAVSHNEIREGFKQGKNANVDRYLADLYNIIRNTCATIKPGGILGLMLGDTVLCGTFVRIALPLIERLTTQGLKLEKLAIRPPRFTEASWVASQRRTGPALGTAISDYVLIFRC